MGCGSSKVMDDIVKNNIEVISGYIIEDSKIEDCIISTDEQFSKFKDDISRHIIVEENHGEGLKANLKLKTRDNEEDLFLSNMVNIDFNKQDLILIRGAKVKDIYQQGDTYHITFEYGYAYNNRYYAVVFTFRKIRPDKINHTNAKPFPYASDRILEYNPHWIN
jgi:hypothetical protein